MKIGTFARNNEQIRSAIKNEPNFIDLRMDLNFTIDFTEAKKDLNDAGIPCTLHLPSNPDWKPVELSRGIVPYIDLGRQIDAEIVTFHTMLSSLFYDDNDIDIFLRALPLACEASKESGVTLAVETQGLYYTETQLLFDMFPDMKMALDIGHGQILATRNRALDHISTFYDRIAMVNVHDNHGSKMIDDVMNMKKDREVTQGEIRELAVRYDTHLPIGEGEIDFDTIFRELKQRGYDSRFLMMCECFSDFIIEREKFMRLWLKA
ncbi:MAG: sugar phosphate isomerase/epimerase family protein [Candidatus Thorarchaeota archaeon]